MPTVAFTDNSQRHVSCPPTEVDITYRHGLDIDATGDRLTFGTTTGSLWVTEDQGDAWQTISEHRPPVYCVRFAGPA